MKLEREGAIEFLVPHPRPLSERFDQRNYGGAIMNRSERGESPSIVTPRGGVRLHCWQKEKRQRHNGIHRQQHRAFQPSRFAVERDERGNQ